MGVLTRGGGRVNPGASSSMPRCGRQTRTHIRHMALYRLMMKSRTLTEQTFQAGKISQNVYSFKVELHNCETTPPMLQTVSAYNL